jgi:glycosyltransferase involved in cell wall biosynthesis
MKISIIIPNYNYDLYITEALDSILNQDYVHMEIIIVDDGSTDNSLSILKEYERRFPDLISVISQKNSGQAFSVNVGIAASSGDIIGWLNSDDYYLPEVFKFVVSSFEDSKDVDILFGNINVVDAHGEYIYTLRHFKFSYFLSTFTGFSNNISSNAVFWRRESFKNNIYLNTEFRCGLDREFFSRLTHRKVVKHINKTIACYRMQPITKAAIGNKDWNQLIDHESNVVFQQAYPNLCMSKIIGVGFAIKLIPLFITYRRLQKLFSGRYLKSISEKNSYRVKNLGN